MQLRWASVEDARGVATVHVDAWRAAYPGLVPQEVLDGLSVETRTEGGNERAGRFYERQGWLDDGGRKTVDGLEELRRSRSLA